jgi:hypothetical protein
MPANPECYAGVPCRVGLTFMTRSTGEQVTRPFGLRFTIQMNIFFREKIKLPKDILI